jgi:tight adherence protein B
VSPWTSATITLLSATLALVAIRRLAASPRRLPTTTGRDGDGRPVRPWSVGHRWGERRAEQAALPGMLEEIAGGLRSGSSLATSLRDVAQWSAPPTAELRAALARVDRGATLAEGLDHWRRTAPDAASRLAATALTHAAVLGGADPRPLEAVASTLRDRAALRGELRVQAAQARASAVVLSVLPPAFLLVVAAADADVAAVLRTPLGWSCVAVGVLLDALGALWMARIVAGAAP